MEGGHDPDCRRCMPWDELEEKENREYIKLDGHQNEIEVLLNCSGEEMKVREEGEILFSRKYADGVLEKNGTLIRRKIKR